MADEANTPEADGASLITARVPRWFNDLCNGLIRIEGQERAEWWAGVRPQLSGMLTTRMDDKLTEFKTAARSPAPAGA